MTNFVHSVLLYVSSRLQGLAMKPGRSVMYWHSDFVLTIQFSLVKADTSCGDFLSGLQRFRLTGVQMTKIDFRAVGICPR